MEEVLKQLEEIYEERREEFKKWEADLAKRQDHIEKLLSEFAKNRKEQESLAEQLTEKEKALIERENQLTEKEKSFSQLYPEFEKMKSELMHLRREKDTIHYEKAFHEGGDMLSRQEHEAVRYELEMQIRELQEERLDLLKNGLGIRVSEETSDNDVEEKELTVDSFADYVKGLCDKGTELLYPGEEKNLLQIKRDDIVYQFLFTMPGEFSVIVDRRDQDVSELEKDYPELQIMRKNDQIIITGYFTDEIAPEDLLKRVYNIGAYL